MGLKYTDLEQVKNEYVSINGVTNSYHKLVENDESLVTTFQNKPGVWECKWFNDDSIPGYQKGSVVWLNTEDIDQFINSKFDEIQHYILNSVYRGEYLSISGDSQQTLQMFKNVCNGTNGYKRLYYLGNIISCAQLRISLSSDNKDLPTENSWRDVLRLSSVQAYKDIILDKTQDYLDQNLSSHVENYHPSSLTMKELTSTYLLNDFSNISLKQKTQTHNIKNRSQTMNGFDKIMMFVERNDDNGTQWFRLWSSGYLEHGGRLTCSGSTITVNLGWTYSIGGSEKNSVIYDYPVVYEGMYMINTELYVNPSTRTIDSNNIGPTMTYNINVTPVATNSVEYKKDTVEVFNITNSSFQFSNENGKITQFSYNTQGFITETSMNKWGIL